MYKKKAWWWARTCDYANDYLAQKSDEPKKVDGIWK